MLLWRSGQPEWSSLAEDSAAVSQIIAGSVTRDLRGHRTAVQCGALRVWLGAGNVAGSRSCTRANKSTSCGQSIHCHGVSILGSDPWEWPGCRLDLSGMGACGQLDMELEGTMSSSAHTLQCVMCSRLQANKQQKATYWGTCLCSAPPTLQSRHQLSEAAMPSWLGAAHSTCATHLA